MQAKKAELFLPRPRGQRTAMDLGALSSLAGKWRLKNYLKGHHAFDDVETAEGSTSLAID